MFLSAILIFILTEYISMNGFNIRIKYIFGNIIIYTVFLFIAFFIFNRLTLAVGISMLLILLFTIGNYYVTQFRGTPISPGDLYAIGTAVKVSSGYQYTLTLPIIFSLCIALEWILIVKQVSIELGKISRIHIVKWSFPVSILLSMALGTRGFAPTLDLWNLNNNIKDYGIALNFVTQIRRMKLSEPDNYSVKELNDLYSKYDFDESEDSFKPNIIVIMNESFSDLSVLSSELTYEGYMSYFNGLTDDVIKGYAYVSTIGGGTSNSEYEFLTGNSMAFLPGMVPFQQIIKNDTSSIVGLLKDRGYTTVAIHPYDKIGYSRFKVYPQLGFDEFLSFDDFEDYTLERNEFITDLDSYRKVTEVFENNKESNSPIFIFNVTIQNHSGYTTGYFEDNTVSFEGYKGIYPDLDEYLTLIQKSDMAISYLIEYFTNVEEPTVLLFFGDHQPNINNDFYQAITGKNLTEWSYSEAQKRYMVPFFVWTNYDIKEEHNVTTSLNYLSALMFKKTGIRLTPYQDFLYEISGQIPAININGYMDIEGSWHGIEEENNLKNIIDTYRNLQYNNAFDNNKIEKWFKD